MRAPLCLPSASPPRFNAYELSRSFPAHEVSLFYACRPLFFSHRMTPSARILGTSKATAQPRRSDNPRPSDGRTGDAYNTPAFSARFGTSNTRLGLSGRAEFLMAHVKIFYTFQKRVKKLAIFLHVKSAAPDPAVKETLRYREALFAGFEEVRRHPLNTNIALKVSSHISGYNMELRSPPGTFIGNPTTLEARYTPPRRQRAHRPQARGLGEDRPHRRRTRPIGRNGGCALPV